MEKKIDSIDAGFRECLERAAADAARGDESFRVGFIAGVLWLMSRPFEQRMSAVERDGIRDSFRSLNESYLSGIRALGNMRLFFGELFRESGEQAVNFNVK